MTVYLVDHLRLRLSELSNRLKMAKNVDLESAF